MEIVVNGMQYLTHSEFFFSSISKYLTIVFVKDVKTGMTKEYADFLDSYADKNAVEKIMKYGFKPYALKDFLVANLDD